MPSKSSVPGVATLVFILVLASAQVIAAAAPVSLVDRPVVQNRSAEPLTIEARQFLLQRNSETARVWLFFTDKGIADKTAFAIAASGVTLGERAIKRRSKVNLDHVVFADLPVVQQYVDDIVNLGGKVRRVSRWLNAASFDIPVSLLDRVTQLPFVASVQPVAGSRRSPVPEEAVDSPDKAIIPLLLPDVLNYGNSAAQLNQINVPALHAQGINGEDVTLAIFDTGYRKSHEAFAQHYIDGRVLAEYDFIFEDGNTANEGVDWSSQWNHGTYIWSTSGGYKDGTIYGPAYKANFILCKTEDVRSETQAEEDNWIAALEWVDGLGADVVTSSLTYMDWYTVADLDGSTAAITLAANTAAGLGIVVCNAMGNEGPSPTTLSPPADAFDMLAVGAVDLNGVIASFSSRGPTVDGRIKPEVCARGVSTYCATTTTDASYGSVSGTSLSTPLVAGVVCQLIQAHPNYPPTMIRQTLMETASQALTPNNDYGWGIIDAAAASTWGADFEADIRVAEVPFTSLFSYTSNLTPSAWTWAFGDGSFAYSENPAHTFTEPGTYNVSLTVQTDFGTISNTQQGFILALGDTLSFQSDSAVAGGQSVMSVNLVNSQALNKITVPFTFDLTPAMTFDSATFGDRTSYFEKLDVLAWDSWNKRYAYSLIADNGGGAPLLPAGSGEVMKLYFTLSSTFPVDTANLVDTTAGTFLLGVLSAYASYAPKFVPGSISAIHLIRGDVNGDLQIDISDLVYMVDYAFGGGNPPVTEETMDVNGDSSIDIADITYMVEYMFNSGPAPVS